MKPTRPLHGKVKIGLLIECKTGLHIGSAPKTLDIGAVDLPVVRNPMNDAPYIPGSSLRGKLRSLLERRTGKPRNRPISTQGQGVWLHVCDTTAAAITCEVCRVFGSSTAKTPGENFPSRLLVRDALMTEDSIKRLLDAETDLYLTEIKHENALDRLTAHATPRQIERVPAGAEFEGELVYAVEELGDLAGDLDALWSVLSLLEDDALGGHGARGSGKVTIHVTDVTAATVQDYGRPRPSKTRVPMKRSLLDARNDLASVVAGFAAGQAG